MVQKIVQVDDGAEAPTVLFEATADTDMGGVSIWTYGVWFTPTQLDQVSQALIECSNFIQDKGTE